MSLRNCSFLLYTAQNLEIQEELGVLAHVERLSYVHELIFEENGKNFHELGFYYLISLPENNELMSKESEFNGIDKVTNEI